MLFNSLISTKFAKFPGINLKDLYLGTPMARPEYMLIPHKMIPDEIIKEYVIISIAKNDMVLAQINCGMYGLP